MLAENPLYSKESSDLNSMFIWFVDTEMIFFSQLLVDFTDLGPASGPVKYAISL